MDEEQAFKRSRNADEMVELRVLLQSKVKTLSHHGQHSLLGHTAAFPPPITQINLYKGNLLFLYRMPVLLLERVART